MRDLRESPLIAESQVVASQIKRWRKWMYTLSTFSTFQSGGD